MHEARQGWVRQIGHGATGIQGPQGGVGAQAESLPCTCSPETKPGSPTPSLLVDSVMHKSLVSGYVMV